MPSPADAFIEQFQQIYFACHQRHVRDVPRGRIISEQQLHILGHLDPVRPTRVGELAEHMGLSHSSISITLDRLARDGYVTREPSPTDKRVTFVRLTEIGEEVRDAQRVLEPDQVDALLARLPAEFRETAPRVMAALGTAAQEQTREWRKGRTPELKASG